MRLELESRVRITAVHPSQVEAPRQAVELARFEFARGTTTTTLKVRTSTVNSAAAFTSRHSFSDVQSRNTYSQGCITHESLHYWLVRGATYASMR